MHGTAYGAVGTAAADVVQRIVDVAVAGLRVGFQQSCRGHDESGLTVATLGHLVFDPGALHGMHAALARFAAETFDGDHRFAANVTYGDRTGSHRHALDMDRTGAADGDAAAELRTDDVQVLAQDPEQWLVRVGVD